MIRISLFFVLLLSGVCAWAQQEHQYTQFMYNRLQFNPAYAGSRGVPSAAGIHRSQWIGFDGAPQSSILSFHTPFITPRVGMGITASARKAGLTNDFMGTLAYSYNLIANRRASLRLGIQGNFRSFGFDFARAEPNVLIDNSLADRKTNETFFNIGAGLYSTIDDKFFIGVSMPRVYKNVIGINPVAQVETAEEAMHFFGMAGAALPVSNDLNLMPAILVKYVPNAPVDVDINLNLSIRNTVTVGTSYRVGGDRAGESVSLLTHLQITELLGVGLSYDFPLMQLRDFNSGSIEGVILLDLRRAVKSVTHPRFFL
jgi:type IX secretion system PorP/SprF family membrane protein